MPLALSTRWNARRHSDGQALAEEIRALGFEAIELGYDLTRDLVPGLTAAVEAGTVRVVSVHAYCPVPAGAPRGHPELFTFADPDPRIRENAVRHTAETIRFAAGLGARRVVVHAGYACVPKGTLKLYRLIEAGRKDSAAYARAQARVDQRRMRWAPRALDRIRAGLEGLAPVLDETGVRLGLENLPFWEAVPSEVETLRLVEELGRERFGYWHDVGHGHVREALGFIRHEQLLARLRPITIGAHIHDARAPAWDHLVPFEGDVDFTALANALPPMPEPWVIEPDRNAAPEALRNAGSRLAALRHAVENGDESG